MPELHGIAHKYHVSMEVIIQAIGLPLPTATFRFDNMSKLTRLEASRIAQILGSSVDIVQTTTLEYYAHQMLSKTTQKNDPVGSRTRLYEALNPYSKRLKVCPICAKEAAKIRLDQQMIWTFACLKHQVLMIDECSTCRNAIASQRDLTGRVENYAKCNNHRVGQEKCPQLLGDLPIISLKKYPKILLAQRNINLVLNGESVRLIGQSTTPLVYLGAIKQLLEILWWVLLPDHVEELPTEITGFIGNLAVQRENRFTALESGIAEEVSSISEYFGCSKLMAVAAPLALECSQLHSQRAVSDTLSRLIQRNCLINPQYAGWLIDFLDRTLTRNDLYWHYAVSELVHSLRKQHRIYKLEEPHATFYSRAR